MVWDGQLVLRWHCFFIMDLYIYALDTGVSSIPQLVFVRFTFSFNIVFNYEYSVSPDRTLYHAYIGIACGVNRR